MAILAVIALAAGIASDDTNGAFWGRHTLLAGLAASAIVVMLSGAVVNEVLERRRRQRWSILAQYIMFELVRNARMIWSGILDVAGLLPAHMNQQDSIEAGADIVRDTPRLTAAVRQIVNDVDQRKRLHDEVAFLAEHADEVLGRWVSVMLNTPRSSIATSNWPATSPGSSAFSTPPGRPTTSDGRRGLAAARPFRSNLCTTATGSPTGSS
jgi:hypothetical protein